MDNAPYTIRFNANDHEIALAGSIRPQTRAEFDPIERVLHAAALELQGTLYLNLKRLRYLNHTGVLELARFLGWCRDNRPQLTIKIVISSVVPWAPARLSTLAEVFANTVVEQYDKAFYPGQGVIENDGLIPVLRTQTNIIWAHEKEILRKHHMRPGLKVADICCGIGDFALLLRKEFQPESIVAVDHSRPFLQYATQVAKEFGLSDIEYQYGDAANLFLPDNSFDFVTSRLALQVFNQPEQIIGELKRICKPGGRVYLSNEMMTLNYAYPRTDSVTWTYAQIVKLCSSLGIDMTFGPKVRALLIDMGFEDVLVEQISVTNVNTAAEDFARVIESWEEYVTGELSTATNQSPETIERMRTGLQDHVYAIRSRRGFAVWPIFIASGTKPLSG